MDIGSDERTRKLIFTLMNSKGENQEQFAEGIGSTRSLISQWKTGKSNSFSNSRYIGKIAEHFNVSTDFLLGKTSTPYNDIDEELDEMLSALKSRPEMRQLFKVSKGATKEDIQRAIEIVKALKKQSGYND